jgi:hypothetical protein
VPCVAGPACAALATGLGQVSRLGRNNGPTLFMGFHFPEFLYPLNIPKLPLNFLNS